MTLDRKASTNTANSIAEVIQAIASDTAHDVLFDFEPTLRHQIPDDLPIEVWNSLCEGVEADLDSLIKTRLQWLVQSIHAEAKEMREMQQQHVIQQALWEDQRNAQLEAQKLKAQPTSVTDVPKIKFINSSRSTAPSALTATPIQVNTDRLDQSTYSEDKPKRLRRRSAASVAI